VKADSEADARDLFDDPGRLGAIRRSARGAPDLVVKELLRTERVH
jgi:hypothetical protein